MFGAVAWNRTRADGMEIDSFVLLFKEAFAGILSSNHSHRARRQSSAGKNR